MQIPILNGVFTNGTVDFRTSYPVNMVPVAQDTGLSAGYLRPADGIIQNGTGPGINRGGINWRDVLYRVMDQDFVSISATGVVTTLGTITGQGRVSMFYGFDQLAIVSNTGAWLYDGSTLQEITDPDLGPVVDGIWIDGYFMFIDPEFIIVTELTNPFAIDPLKYGSSEADPDPLKAIVKIRNEAYVLNRHTTEVFDNIGSPGFPFQRIDSERIGKLSHNDELRVNEHKISIDPDAIDNRTEIRVSNLLQGRSVIEPCPGVRDDGQLIKPVEHRHPALPSDRA